MTRLSKCLIPFVLAVLLWPLVAGAACFAPGAVTEEALKGYKVSTLQAGVRTALGDTNPRLRDGTFGSYSKAQLSRLCTTVPRTDLKADLASTLDLADQYGRLADTFGLENWRERLLSREMRAAFAREPNLPLRLAGTNNMRAALLSSETKTFNCADAEAAIQAAPRVADRVSDLSARFLLADATALCEAFPVTGPGLDFVAALVHFSTYEALLKGSLDDLVDPDFAAWVAADYANRALRLAGNQPAVVNLIEEYRAQKPTPSEPALADPCAKEEPETTLVFYALSAEEIAALEETLDLTKTLDSFAADNPGFASKERLWAALKEVLAPVLEDCILPGVQAVVLDDKNLGQSFSLNKEGTKNLLVQPQLQDSLPAIEGFAEASARTQEQLLSGIKAVLETLHQTRLDAEIELAADTLAAAAEPVEPLLDTRTFEIEDLPEVEIPDTIGVTDATARALSLTLKNESFQRALTEANYIPATVPELLKAEVRAILEPIAKTEVSNAVTEDLKLITPVAEANWSMTPELAKAILTLPSVAQATNERTATDLVKRTKAIAGIQYPTARLLETALNTAEPLPGDKVGTPFSEPMLVRLVRAARKEIADPEAQAPRFSGPLAMEDCACAPFPRQNAEVYGFYPFWFAPLLEETKNLPEGEEPPLPEKVNYQLMTRTAFYGLELDFDDASFKAENREVILRNENRWGEAKRNFINSAHRHRSAVDVTFDLRNWQQWTSRNITQAVGKISAQMAPFKRFPRPFLSSLREGLPTLFDPVQADGLTLIFHGYDANKLSRKDMEQLLDIVEQVYEGLPGRDRLEINVGFDFALLDNELRDPIFDELFDLLIEKTIIVQKQEFGSDGKPIPAKVVEVERDTVRIIKRILLFLERDTSDSKKGLRFRMEQGLFQGEQRRSVLRSIIPILPPTANEFVETRVKAKRVADQRKTFSQFEDDVVYFKDNFGGIGFWPVPKLEGAETPVLTEIVMENFHPSATPPLLEGFEAQFTQTCNWACPNRAYIALFAMALFVFTSLLTWRSYYNGKVATIGFRFMVFGLVGFGNAAILGILLVLTNCDRASTMPKILLYLFSATLVILILGHLIQRARRGPDP